ncbi:unnamed protein product [Brassicogethes aeneus]|uniref:DUF4371 domain-containing protein n=1 Tax=Brassicogethes aeneus TaxID=1431903 RepID=A0A9P0BEF8_BRAAE|nr:unnamed protein product [Brassicogethes aeneus]
MAGRKFLTQRELEDAMEDIINEVEYDLGTSKLDVFVKATSKDNEKLVKAAEATLAYHTVKHHQSFNSMDCATNIHRKMYQESSILKSVTCGHTKVEAIVNGVLGPSTIKAITNQISGISFIGVSTDASNHNAIKMFPILIQYFDFKKGGIQIKLIDICSSNNETSETVTDLLYSVLEKLELTTKCISFSGDNCNTNFGGINRTSQNNIFSRLTLR